MKNNKNNGQNGVAVSAEQASDNDANLQIAKAYLAGTDNGIASRKRGLLPVAYIRSLN